MNILRQSTAVDVLIGPFVDSTDGNTEETGLTIAQADVMLSKNGQGAAQKNDNTTAAHDADGMYNCELDATDTNTVGQLTLYVHVAGALYVRHDYQVIEEAVYDALYAGSALGYVANAPVNVAQISGDSTAADNLEVAFDDTAGPVPALGILDQGTAQSASATGVVLRAAAAFGDDTLIGATIMVHGSDQGYWQSRIITDSALSGDSVTVETWSVTPSGTITYKIFATAPSSGGGGLDAAGVRSALGMASANLDTQLSTIDTVVDAILVDTGTTLDGRIPAALVGGRMDASVGAMAANVMTAAAAAADLTTELQSGLATAAALATVDGVVDAIQAKTDQLTFGVTGKVDSNATHMNETEIAGTGVEGDKWRGA